MTSAGELFLRLELQVLIETSLTSSRQSWILKAMNAALPMDGLDEESMCIGFISSVIESSLAGES